ncbi:MAG TPA: hypothetical protein VD905_13305 [Flavobacteriales bacterium]|nr:hypothetical protein [Flavobacteriales bacterium]
MYFITVFAFVLSAQAVIAQQTSGQITQSNEAGNQDVFIIFFFQSQIIKAYGHVNGFTNCVPKALPKTLTLEEKSDLADKYSLYERHKNNFWGNDMRSVFIVRMDIFQPIYLGSRW